MSKVNFWAPKITADGTTALKLKDASPWKKTMTNLDSILESRDITLSTKVYLVKAMIFPVVMYGREIWAIQKAECQIIVFELWIWRRFLRVTWTIRPNQSIPKEINPEYSLEGLMLSWSTNTLTTWWDEPIYWKRLWCWERLETKGKR